MTIILYLGSKYTTSYHVIDLVDTVTNIQNPTVYTQTLLSKATAYYNPIPKNYLYLE